MTCRYGRNPTRPKDTQPPVSCGRSVKRWPDVTADAFIDDIHRADTALHPWAQSAPRRLFRHPLCHWGDTLEKLAQVNGALASADLTPVDVTSWSYEWVWNRAYRNAVEACDANAIVFVKDSFLEFSIAQLRHDQIGLTEAFGPDAVAIALGHNVPFFADIADAFFAHWIAEGVEFVPLQEALTPDVVSATGSVVSSKFLPLPQKLADAGGKPIAQIAPDVADLHTRITKLAVGQTG